MLLHNIRKININKVDVQNNILHAMWVKKRFFTYKSFPVPHRTRWTFSGSNISKKVFGGQISAN